MEYITGIHALNIPCSLETGGDWHASALQWERPRTKNTEASLWGDYGIEVSELVPENPGKHFVANHIRACLDLLDDGNFGVAQGMCDDFICNDKYNEEIFHQVLKLRARPHWEQIRTFMMREYGSNWLDFEKRQGVSNMELKYYRVCRVRCKSCGDLLEHGNQTKQDNHGTMMWCSCGKIGLDPSATFYRIAGNGIFEGSFEDAFEYLSEEWED